MSLPPSYLGNREMHLRSSEECLDLPEIQLRQTINRLVERIALTLIPLVWLLRVRVDPIGDELPTHTDDIDVPALKGNAAARDDALRAVDQDPLWSPTDADQRCRPAVPDS
jgi:hypothetical protein